MTDISFDRDLCIRCGQCIKICSMGHLRMEEYGPDATGRGGCMDCLQCAAICPKDAVRRNGAPATVPRPEDSLEELIMSRRSIRHFKSQPPEKEIIQWALDMAGYAPSGKNRKANRWTVIYGRDHMTAISDRALQHCQETGYAPELLKLTAKGIDLLTCGASVMVIGWSPDDCLNPTVDTIAAMEVADLLLVHRGLGTCWGGYMRRIVNACPDLQKMLGIPEHCSVQGCFVVGWPENTFPRIPVRPAAEIYWA